MHYRESVFFKVCVFLILSTLIGQPVLAQQMTDGSQQQIQSGSDFLDGKLAGELDAKASGSWFFAGFCGGLVGLLIAYSVKPSPSTAQLVGKPQAYISGYIEGYKDKCASLQGKKALTGFAVSCVITSAIYLALVVAVASDDDLNSGW